MKNGEIDWKKYARGYDLMCEFNPEYQKLIRFIKNKIEKLEFYHDDTELSFAELGSGTGNFTIEALANSQFAPQVTSLEYTAEFLNIQKKKIKRKGLENKINLINGDIRSPTLAENSQDLILMVHVLNIFPQKEREQILNLTKQYLKEGGYFMIADIGREIDVLNWTIRLYSEVLKKEGIKALFQYHKQTQEVRKQNSNARKRQNLNISYLHSLKEFKNYIEEFGFQTIEAHGELYGNLDDFLILQKLNSK